MKITYIKILFGGWELHDWFIELIPFTIWVAALKVRLSERKQAIKLRAFTGNIR